jgi:Cu-Zn family superoxide dismutase
MTESIIRFNRFQEQSPAFPQAGRKSAEGGRGARTARAAYFGLLLALSIHAAASAVEVETRVRIELVSAQGVGAGIGVVRLAESKGGLELTPSMTNLAPGLHALAWRPTGDCRPGERNGHGIAAGASLTMKDADQDPAVETILRSSLPPIAVDGNGVALKPVAVPGLKMAMVAGRALVIFQGATAGDEQPVVACGTIP